MNISKVPFQWTMGIITTTTLRFDLWLAPLLIIGTLAGVVVHQRISQRAFDTLVLVLAAAAALQMILF